MAGRNERLLIWSNCSAFIVMVLVNGLAGSTTFLGGKLTAEISNANPTLLTPAGYVFAIWGVIYVLLGIFVVYQALPRNRAKGLNERIGWLFVINSALNVLWLFAWQYEYLSLSVIIMFLLLATLILIYLRLDIGRRRVDRGERFAVHLAFSTYLGWITIATIANVSATLVSLGWDGFGMSPVNWAVLVALLALAISILMVLIKKDIAYELVIIWAFLGIAANQSESQIIVALMWLSVAVIVIALSASFVYSRSRQMRRSTS